MWNLGDLGQREFCLELPTWKEIRFEAGLLSQVKGRSHGENWQDAEETAIGRVHRKLERYVGPAPGLYQLARKLVVCSISTHNVWLEEGEMCSSGESTDEACDFLAGVGFELVGTWKGATLMRDARYWGYWSSGNNNGTSGLAYDVWLARRCVTGQADRDWFLAEWLLELAKIARFGLKVDAIPSYADFMAALGTLIMRNPARALWLFDQAA